MTPAWSTACVDWADRLINGRSIIPAPIFPEEAERALAVFKQLRIVDAPGSPTFGEACAPWVFDLVASVFGACDPSSGRRLITEWFVCLPKKNSKSTIAAGIMVTALILNWRRSAEFAVLAPTIEIAANSFAPARDMCSEQTDEELGALMHVQTHIKSITHRNSNATLKVVAADSDTVGGKKSVGTLVDELWLFGKRPNSENMLREAIGGLASRPEGFVIYLTTQSDDPPAGVFAQKLQYARAVRDGRIQDERFVPIIYEFPDAMIKSNAHLDPENFRVVNPNLGYSVDDVFLRRELRKAQEAGEGSLRGFLAKHLNVEIGLALQANTWAGAMFWEGQGDRTLTLDEVLRRSEVVTIGIDGGGLDDLLGLAVVGREKGKTGRWLHWGHAWAHSIVLERRKSEAERFKQFAREGDLTIVQRIGDDIEQLVAIVQKCEKAAKLDRIGVDAAGIDAIVEAIVEGCKIDADKRVLAISQGWKLNGAIKTLERRLAEGNFVHGGSPMMAWCVGNARVEPVGNAIRITKQISGSAKIDPVMAMFDATSLLPDARARHYKVIGMR